MEDGLIKLVRTYRLTAGLADRLLLAEEIFRLVEPQLRFFVLSDITPPAAEDVLQEALKAVATRMDTFRGDSAEQFWKWCYRIARNKLVDHHRIQKSERTQALPPEELWQLVDASAQDTPLSPADRHDLEYAMKLLTASRPECRDFLWKHFVFGLTYNEIADELDLKYDNVRMKIGRCLQQAQALVS